MITKRSDLIYTDILQEAISGAFAGQLALYGTGAAVMSTTLPGLGPDGTRYVGGDTIRVPYFDTIGDLEDLTEGDALTPVKLTMTSETSTIIHSGKAGEITNWAQMAAMYADPYAEYGKQFTTAWMRRIDSNLITAAATSTLVLDISAIGSGLLTYNAVVDATQLWNDEQDEQPVLLVVHSQIYGDMRKLADSTGRPLMQDPKTDGKLSTFMGIPIRVSDRVPVSGSGASAVYTTLIIKRGALAAWCNGTPSVQTDKDILADTDVIAIHTYHVAHLYSRPRSGTLRGVVLLKTKAS